MHSVDDGIETEEDFIDLDDEDVDDLVDTLRHRKRIKRKIKQLKV